MGAATRSGRSPVPAILVSIVVGFLLAVLFALTTAPDGPEPLVTGSVMLAFGLGWALMAWLTTRFSGQPQRWMYVPAASLAGTGAVLSVIQPAPSIMDLLGWVWPVAITVLAIWMIGQLRQELRGIGRWLVGALIGVLLFMAAAGAVMTGAAATADSASTSPGQLVDIGGRRLYLHCEGTGAPVVVLQAGLGGDSSGWARIQPSIAATTTVCSYDRAGRGRSDPAPGRQNAAGIATDLHDLLAKAGVSGPYVLVGHSSGGPYVRVFQHKYIEEVVGMVLVDAQPADAFTSLPDYAGTYDYLVLTSGLAPSLARLGLLGPLFGVGPTEVTAPRARSIRDEYRALPGALEQAADVVDLGSMPLIVVSADTGSQRGWAEAQVAQVALSTNGIQRIVADSTHQSLLVSDSAASARAILDVVRAVREGTPVR